MLHRCPIIHAATWPQEDEVGGGGPAKGESDVVFGISGGSDDEDGRRIADEIERWLADHDPSVHCERSANALGDAQEASAALAASLVASIDTPEFSSRLLEHSIGA